MTGRPRLLAAASLAFVALLASLAVGVAQAQGLTVLPVTVELAPGQMTTALTVINQADSETSFQIRAFAWGQASGADQLSATDELLASPPLGTIAANATQVVRIVLRRPVQGREASYRILLDQIPPPAASGTVRIALRLSIPIFAEPATRVAAHLQWRVESRGGQAFLVVVNDGSRHEAARDIALGSAQLDANSSPYVLPGATRRWRIAAPAGMSGPGTTVRLTARADTGVIDQPVPVVAGP